MQSFAEPVAKTVGHTVPLIRAAVLLVSIAAAIPTAHNLYYSWQHGVPFNQVSHRLAQYDLWMKNLDCKVDYKQLLTAAGSKVDVGACPKSGDIAIKVSGAGGTATYEWIAFTDLQKPTSASLMGLLIPPALAQEAPKPPQQSKAPTAAPIQLAQAGMEVKCQAQSGNGTLIRIVQDAGKCYREKVSMIKGSVEKREEVPCTTQCK
jgi:hypothetical protein